MDSRQVVIWMAGGLVRYEASEETANDEGRAIGQLGEDESDGTWIEIDIEPLFPSSERRPVIDLTVENEPENR